MKHVIYGYDLSYFTRKVEAAFQLKGIPHQRVSKTLWRRWPLEALSGTHQVPVVRTPRLRLLTDSTPIITYLDQLNGESALHGSAANGVLIRVIEEWLDEWLPRTVLHYRWSYPECAKRAGEALARETLPLAPARARRAVANFIAGWGKKACRALGVDTPHQQRAAEAEALRLFEALEGQLERTPYALGDRPTAVDATLLGGLRAHFLQDPVPRRVLDGFPRTLAWATRPAPIGSGGDLPQFPETTDFGRFVLDEFAGPYKRFILANAAALQAGQKAFSIACYEEPQSYLARAYPETSRQMVNQAIGQLDAAAQSEVAKWLTECDLHTVFSAS